MDLEKMLDDIYEYTLTNGDVVIWALRDILPLMQDMGRTYEGCIYSGRLKKNNL